MADEFDLIKGTGLGALLMSLGSWVVSRIWRRGEQAQEKVEADKETRLVHCEKSLENHRDLLAVIRGDVRELDTRLKFREGGYGSEPITMTKTMTPELRARVAAIAAKDDDE